MNLLKQTIPYNQISSAVTKIARPFSALATVEVPNQSEEPDKLYKTLELELRGNDPAVLRSYSKFATLTGENLNIECKTWTLKKPLHERWTLLKSAHIYKKHMVQYEIRTYFSFIQYKHLTGSTADTLLEYLERNLPEGVALKATKVELQKVPDHLTPPTPM